MELESKLDDIERIANKLKFDLLKHQLIDSTITSVDTLKRVTRLLFDNAVVDPTLCPLYAQLCSDLFTNLPSFPSYNDKTDGKDIFSGLLLNRCQESLYDNKLKTEIATDEDLKRTTKLQTRGKVSFTCELFKRNIVIIERIVHIILQLLLPDGKVCVDEENLEAVCQFLFNIGKHLDDSSYGRYYSDYSCGILKKVLTNQQLSSGTRFMILDVINLRSNDWVPRLEKEPDVLEKAIWKHRRTNGIGHCARLSQKLSESRESMSMFGESSWSNEP